MRDPTKIYRRLLSLYPARFRETYEAPMERQFADEYREASSRRARMRVWQRAIWDLATTAPGQALGELRLDLKHGIRAYRSRWVSTTLAVAALGLAIGASTGVFSVLNALLLRELPFAKPSQLVEMWFPPVSAFGGRAKFHAAYRGSPFLESAAAFSLSEMNLTGRQHAFRLKAAETSANFFSLLGIRAVAGRTFAPDEDIQGHDAVAVIGYGLWQELFAGDPAAIGKSLQLNGVKLTIIGVSPASFDYPGKATIWIPTVFDFAKIPKSGAFFSHTIGRLKSDIRLQTAQKIFESEARRANRKAFRQASTDWQNRPRLVSLQEQLAGPLRQASWALAALIFLLLLTACANVAHLLLSRTTERRKELAIRAALGASRARLLQQLVTEATSLTAAGAIVGLPIAYWISAIASVVAPAQLATQHYTILDWRVLGFAAGLAVVLGFVFGVAPVWLLGRLQPSGAALQNSRGAPDHGTRRARAGLIAAQAALTLCLLVSSLVLARTFLRLLNVDLGFYPASVVTINVSLTGTRHNGRGKWPYYGEALQKLRAFPGVESAGAVSYLPLKNYVYMASSFKLNSGQTVKFVVLNAATPGYFHALGTGFLAGRDFANEPGTRPEAPIIVNEAFAQAAGLGEQIVGREVTESMRGTQYRIVGVVRTTRFGGPADRGGPQIYERIQDAPPLRITFVAKVRGRAREYLAPCRDAIRSVDREVAVYDVKTLRQRLDSALARPRFYTISTGFLAALGILLSAAGIYGTAAYSIAQRRKEMGIRMALGATHRRVRRLMLRETMTPAAIGMAAGIALSLASGQYLQHLIANVAPPAFWTCATAVCFLLLTGLIAAWSATAEVLSIEPAEALRAE